ncbi:MAG: metalloregulator ArsR/SmtB family transcription factor [Gemmatimonadetes bacterium]|nr:metalloregulator ArsR/SmtB family transcription factor [Gemmatimonadota bacterium]
MKRSLALSRLAALADPIRARLVAALERQELTVGELRAVLQLPQSTVSRHLRALADAGLISGREDGTSNLYRLGAGERDGAGRKLWMAVRDEVLAMPAVQRDATRIQHVLAARHTTSQRFFAGSAGQWERIRSELFGARSELLPFIGLLDPVAVVADLGCGAGHFAAAVAPAVRRVIAIDESAAMIRVAKARLGDAPNVEVRQGSLEALPLADAEVDVAVLSLVLHYVSDPAAVLAGVRRTLRPGGRCIIVDLRPHERADLRDRLGHVWAGFADADLRAWAQAVGFTSCTVRASPGAPEATGPALFVATLAL